MQDKIILATGHAHAFHRASTLAALNNGYFLDEGLSKVELKATGECSLTVESLKSGNIDFGLDVRSGLILEENNKGSKVYIIAGMLNHLDMTFIGARDIKSIGDLRGKKIGIIEKGGGREVPWMRMLLRKERIDPDKDVTWVLDCGYTSLDIQGPRLDRGDYQATVLSAHHKRPELFQLVRQSGYNLLAEHSETHPDGLPDRVVATRGNMLTQYPQVVKGVLKGIVRGYRFARDPKNAQKLRQMYVTQDWGRDGFGWGKFDDKLIDGMVRSSRILPSDGSVSLSGLDAVIEEYKAWGKLPQGYTKEKAIRLKFLQEAVNELNAKFGTEGY
jgi:ABC-type nitrate/sulfonate/bicarbonate transport system substrate-binding protein